MATATTEQVSLRSIIEDAYEAEKPTRELAETALPMLSDEHRDTLILRALEAEFLHYEATVEWRPPRSGHSNKSGRLGSVASLPDRGIFGKTIRTNDGNAYLMADVTAEVCAALIANYGEREKRNAAGRKFFAACRDEMQKAGLSVLRDLGEERVEALQRKFGYRVS